MKYCKIIKELRLENRLSQQDVADYLKTIY